MSTWPKEILKLVRRLRRRCQSCGGPLHVAFTKCRCGCIAFACPCGYDEVRAGKTRRLIEQHWPVEEDEA